MKKDVILYHNLIVNIQKSYIQRNSLSFIEVYN